MHQTALCRHNISMPQYPINFAAAFAGPKKLRPTGHYPAVFPAPDKTPLPGMPFSIRLPIRFRSVLYHHNSANFPFRQYASHFAARLIHIRHKSKRVCEFHILAEHKYRYASVQCSQIGCNHFVRDWKNQQRSSPFYNILHTLANLYVIPQLWYKCQFKPNIRFSQLSQQRIRQSLPEKFWIIR